MHDLKSKLHELYISPEDSLFKALEVINNAGGGYTKIALIIDSNNRLTGIMNDGDIRRALLKKAALNDPVKKYFKRDFEYVWKNTSRRNALNKMKTFSISHVPVLNSRMEVIGMHFLQEFLIRESITNTAVIMAGGKGTRLRPITNDIPKPMIKVAGTPILEHIIHHLVCSGIKKIYITVNYKAEIIENYFQRGESFGCSISYIKEEKPLGTAGALSILPKIENDLILMNGDLITQFNLAKILEMHNKNNNSITIGARDHIQTISYGVLNTSGNEVTEIIEKPEKHYLVNGGVYILKPEVLSLIPNNTIFFATDLIEKCININKKVGYYLLDEDWIDVGEFTQLNKARGI